MRQENTDQIIQKKKRAFLVYAAIIHIAILLIALVKPGVSLLLVVSLPLTWIGWQDLEQTQNTLLRNFPLLARVRPLMEEVRPFIRQYFLESELDAAPVRRQYRSLIHNRSQKKPDTIPFGSKVDMYEPGYEWIGHSINALDASKIDNDMRVTIGGPACKQPYEASILNISAMSFGALSETAIRALNKGAALGGFAHNTGEGSLSPHHFQGGDIVWQIGTGYFGCRDKNGHFCEEKFAEKARQSAVKMIEIKLSQGAKPGHGGILPASKNTLEIAEIRGVEPHTTVHSPSAHSTFSNPVEMLAFIQKLRELSGGKPVGIKLCVGRRSEFLSICKGMIATEIMPDFITIDGGEGGTGAAPLEYSDSIGMPLREALTFVVDCLTGFNLREHIKIIASGKAFNAAHMVRNYALGADICNSARGMMLAMGCIQSLQCNKNTCPTGIATQNPKLFSALDVDDKAQRVCNFHEESLENVSEILSAAGLTHTQQLDRSYMYRRVSELEIKRFDEIYPYPATGSLLAPPYPDPFDFEMNWAVADKYIHKEAEKLS